MFGNFMDKIKQGAGNLKSEVLKFKNTNFLNAACAGSASIALADGSIDAEEKQKMIRLIESNDALSVFEASAVIKKFKEYVEAYEFDADVGQSKAFEALIKLRGKDVEARTVMRLILSIAAADGDFDKQEKAIAKKIAIELGLSPSEFDL